MVTIPSLAIAIVVSAVVVWVLSALAWMVSPWHKNDFAGVPGEDKAREALKGLPPGQYDIPHMSSPSEMKDPAMVSRFTEGPVGFLTIKPSKAPGMGGAMLATVLFYLFVSIAVAYVASRTLPVGAPYLKVFQVTGTVAWIAHSFAVIPDAIWFGKPKSAVAKALFDGMIYALFTGGVFGWLWPQL